MRRTVPAPSPCFYQYQVPPSPVVRRPQVSVIIIFYNEAMSTLLRNLIGVLNLSPPDMLGEVVMVDDNSSLPQLKFLEQHLDRLPALARKKVFAVTHPIGGTTA